MGYEVFSDNLDKVNISEKLIINTINPHSYCVAKKDELFRTALKSSDVLLPDGIGIVLATRLLKKKKIKKIAGADVHQFCLEKANKEGGSVFYLGAAQTTLDKIIGRLSKDYPNIRAGSFSPPYKPAFSDEDNQKMIAEVNAFEPDYLFIGMTAPKQEKWVYSNKNELDAKIICSIGAVFDFYAGTVSRPHPFWIKIGMEWFIRFVKEPRRLAERNLISMPKFILDVITAKFIRK